jgi:hypothetical protein
VLNNKGMVFERGCSNITLDLRQKIFAGDYLLVYNKEKSS